MIAGLSISIVSVLLMASSALFAPEVRIKHRHPVSLYCLFPLLGAILLLIFGLVDAKEVASILLSSSPVNPLQILIIFFSMTFTSLCLDEFGFFSFLAELALRKAGKSQFGLFSLLFLFVSILTVFTSNDIIVLTFTPFLLRFCKKSGISPLPHLLGCFVAANTFSALLPIGNPTNIYLTSSLGVSFGQYLSYMALPSLSAGLLAYLCLLFLFRKSLSKPMEKPQIEAEGLQDKTGVVACLVSLSLNILCCALSSFLPIPSYLGCLLFASLLAIFCLLRSRHGGKRVVLESAKRLPFSLLPLLLGMFVIVLALGEYGLTKALGEALSGFCPELSFGYASLLLANLVNNIPMSVFFEEVFADLGAIDYNAFYAVALGSNVAAYLTPLGALAGLLFVKTAKSEGVEISFLSFCTYGVPTALLALSAGLGVIALESMFF